MANITTTTAANFIPEVWAMDVIVAAEKALVVAPLVYRADSQVKNKGDIIHFPQISELTVSTKTQGSEITPSAVTESEVQVTVNTWKYAAFEIEGIAKVQSAYDLRSLYTKKIGYQAAADIDTAILNLYSSLTSTDVGNYGTDIGDAAIISCQQRLDEVDAPREDRYFVIKPSQKAAIQKLDKFTWASAIGQMTQASPVQRGPNNRYLWGDVYGDPVYYTNQVTTTAGTPTQTHNLYFHKEAFVLALQQTPTVRHSYWHKDLSDLVSIDWIYGTNTLRSTFGVELRS